MTEDKILEELEEISQMVEGEEENVSQQLEEIEKLATTSVAAGAAAEKAVERKEEEKKEEVKEEKPTEAPKERKEEKKVAPKPEKAIKGSGLRYAAVFLIIIGFVIYALAFYLRWNGWRIINNPPSSVVALAGTMLILAGGEVYFRGKER